MQDAREAVIEAARDQRAHDLRAAIGRIGWPRPRATMIRLAVLSGVMLCAPVIAGLGISWPAMLTVFVSAAISSIAGFAFSALCGAVLAHLGGSPVAAVQIILVSSIAMQGLSVWALRREIEWAHLPQLLLGGMLGLPAGLWLLLHLDRHQYAHGLGALLLVYAGWMLLKPTIAAPRWMPALAVPVGFMGGITGGLAAFPSPAVTIWCTLQGWSKTRQRGLTQPFILIMQIVSLSVLHLSGKAAAPHAASGVAWGYVPAALLGTAVGLAVYRRMSDRQFASAVNVLLIISGLGMLA